MGSKKLIHLLEDIQLNGTLSFAQVENIMESMMALAHGWHRKNLCGLKPSCFLQLYIMEDMSIQGGDFDAECYKVNRIHTSRESCRLWFYEFMEQAVHDYTRVLKISFSLFLTMKIDATHAFYAVKACYDQLFIARYVPYFREFGKQKDAEEFIESPINYISSNTVCLRGLDPVFHLQVLNDELTVGPMGWEPIFPHVTDFENPPSPEY